MCVRRKREELRWKEIAKTGGQGRRGERRRSKSSGTRIRRRKINSGKHKGIKG